MLYYCILLYTTVYYCIAPIPVVAVPGYDITRFILLPIHITATLRHPHTLAILRKQNSKFAP